MFLPDTIDLGQSEKYILSIRIKATGFMFSIHEPGVGKNYCLRETTFSTETSMLNNIQRIIFDLNFLTQQFSQTNVIIVSSDYSVVPISYFDNNEISELYNFGQTNKSYKVLSCTHEKQKCATLFGIDEDLYRFLSRSLYNPNFYHHSYLLIDMLEDKGKRVSLGSTMHLNFHNDILDIICFSHSKLKHCLTYENESPANQIYYILKLWEQTGFNQLNDQLHISGEPDEEMVKTLQEYIKNTTTVGKITGTRQWSEDAQKAPLDLITLSL